MTDDIDALYARERDTLLDDLARLDEHQWAQASWCPGWDVRDVVAHLMMPFELGITALLGRMFTTRFNFDRVALTWAASDTRTPVALQQALAATNGEGFNVPGAGPLAPLSHLTIHAHDIRGPLSIDTPISPAAARRVLGDITQGKHAVPAALLAGLRLETVDAEWSFGQGKDVTGPAGALLSALSGRAAAVEQLDGEGIATLRARVVRPTSGSPTATS